jgi:hypothetical protein
MVSANRQEFSGSASWSRILLDDLRWLVFAVSVPVVAAVFCIVKQSIFSRKAATTPTSIEGMVVLRHRLRDAVVVLETAFAVVLLVGSGLALRELAHVLTMRPGFNDAGVLTMRVSLGPNRETSKDGAAAFARALLGRIDSLPGVISSAAFSAVPPTKSDESLIQIPGGTQAGRRGLVHYVVMTPGALQAMSIPLLDGRAFDHRDNEQSHRVAIVSETLVRQFFPGGYPIGKSIVLDSLGMAPREVVGVSLDVRDLGVDGPVEPTAYIPYAQHPLTDFMLAVKCAPDPLMLSGPVRREIAAADKAAQLSDVRPMSERVVWSPSRMAHVVPVSEARMFVCGGLFLTLVGISIMMMPVNSRVKGAGNGDVGILRTLHWGAVGKTVLGMALGIPGALALSSWLFTVLVLSDPFTYVAAACIVLAAVVGLTGSPNAEFAHEPDRVLP